MTSLYFLRIQMLSDLDNRMASGLRNHQGTFACPQPSYCERSISRTMLRLLVRGGWKTISVEVMCLPSRGWFDAIQREVDTKILLLRQRSTSQRSASTYRLLPATTRRVRIRSERRKEGSKNTNSNGGAQHRTREQVVKQSKQKRPEGSLICSFVK